MDLGLAGRVYILTGASRGLGFATAECLVADGAHVVIAARDSERIAEAVAALNAAGPGSAMGFALHNADPTTPGQLIGAALEKHGRLDGGLISVGGPPRGTAAGITEAQWRESFETVFLGSVRLACAMANRLGGSNDSANLTGTGDAGTPNDGPTGGAIGFVLSSSVRAPIPGLGISNGLRPGLAGVAKDMADEYGPRGVRVFSLLPGSIYTDRLRDIYGASGDAAVARANAEAGTALHRLGEPEEFGRVAAFALSPAASYLTGLTIPVDGGAIRSI
jgi:3-oxoacyl-[acyl-carrier protein] reductase